MPRPDGGPGPYQPPEEGTVAMREGPQSAVRDVMSCWFFCVIQQRPSPFMKEPGSATAAGRGNGKRMCPSHGQAACVIVVPASDFA